jgi:hypothetical protein
VPFRLGVEEELLFADRQSLALAPVTERVLASAPSNPGRLWAARTCSSTSSLLAEGNGADRQRAAHATGGIPAALRAVAIEPDSSRVTEVAASA